MKNLLKKFIKILSYIVGVLIVIIVGLAVVLWFKSPGKADPIVDSSGKTLSQSISTIEKVSLGGLDQYLIIRGADTTKPVMLYLHGGPGSPEVAFIKNTNIDIENDFIMVYWEQRGSGKSYSKNIPPESMTLHHLISDTRELSEYLAKRFKRQKIYLMGHSWGSFLGILTAYQYPELYYSYMGVGQVAYQYEGEKIAFEWVKDQATKRNDEKAIIALSEITFPDSLASSDKWFDYLGVERNYVTKYGGGITHEMTGMLPVLKMIIDAKEYTFMEKMNFMSGAMFSLENLWPDMANKNLFKDIDSMQLPVYIYQGIHDHQTPYTLAKDFYDQLKAPSKEFFTFTSSAHSPNMEEVDRFNKIVREKAVEEQQTDNE